MKDQGHIRNTTMTNTIYKMPRHHNSHLNVINPINSLYQSIQVTTKSNLHLLNHSPAFFRKFPRRRKRRKRKGCSDFNGSSLNRIALSCISCIAYLTDAMIMGASDAESEKCIAKNNYRRNNILQHIYMEYSILAVRED